MPTNNKQTTLDLNGPILSFVTQPSSTSVCGVATFIGIATATFPTQDPSNLATPTGYISYKWYAEDTQSSTIELVDGDFNGSTITGSATTTLTITPLINLTNYKFFLKADYIPSAYVVSGSDVTAGTARSTGNAINDPINSDVVTLVVNPEITITKHPKSAEFITTEAVIRIIDDQGTETSISPNEVPFYNSFTPGKLYTIISSVDVDVDVQILGAGGGSSYVGAVKSVGGKGGFSTGKVTLLANQEYKLVVGTAGGNSLSSPGYGGGGSNTRGGGGGGYSGLFLGSVSQSNAILIAGGGGGGGTLSASTYTSTVLHVFDNKKNRHTLTQTSPDITVNYIGASSADGLPCDNDLSYKHYQVKFNTPFIDDTYGIEINNIAQKTAGGRSRTITNSGISDKTKYGFRVWFCANGFNSYVRSFDIVSSGVKEGFNIENDPSTGGNGGGNSGTDFGGVSGRAGTQFSGGINGGSSANSGGPLQGGSGAGGGGGGYYGGGGGQINPNASLLSDGGGGGGSGYIHPTLITNGSMTTGRGASSGIDGSVVFDFEPVNITSQEFNASFSVDAEVNDNSDDQIQYQWQLNEVDLVDSETTIRVPKNNYDYSTNALLRLPLWDKNSDSIVDLIDLTNVPNTVLNTNVSWVTGGGKFYDGHAYFDGSSYLEVTPESDFNFGTGDFTVETWAYFTTTGINEIFSCGPYTTERAGQPAQSQNKYPTENYGWYTRTGSQQTSPYSSVRQLVIRWEGTTVYDSSINTDIPLPSSESGVTVGEYTYFPVSGRIGSSQYGWSNDYNNAFNVYRVSSSFTIRKNLSSELEASVSGTFVSGGILNLNTWHHIAASRKDGTIKLFIDGKTVATKSWNSVDITSSYPVLIGKSLNSIQEYPMFGRIQDFQVYGVAKYTTDFSVPTEAIVDKRLVLDIPLWDEGTNILDLDDLSPNKKTITSGSTYGKPPLWVKGVGKFYGGSAYFNGGEYLNVSASEDFNFGTEDFTIELWCRFSSWTTNTYEVLVNVGGEYSGSGGTWFSLLRNNSGGATFYLADTTGYQTIGSTSDLKLETWRHLAVSKNSSGVKFYIDGILIQTTNISSWTSQSFGGNASGYIGLQNQTSQSGVYYYPQCYMQDIKIYKGLDKYTTQFSPDQSSSVTFNSTEYVEKNVVINGARTKNLFISTQDVSKNLLRCKISQPTACNSLLYSNTVAFNVVSSYNPTVANLVAEVYYNDATMSFKTINIANDTYSIYKSAEGTLQGTKILASDTICLYAKERDLYVEVEMYGSKGKDKTITIGKGPSTVSKNYFGGEGGYSKIRFYMKKGEEYILRGINSGGAIWLYRKSQLIACVGEGGSAGSTGNGGRGGGVGVSGENGFSRPAGDGGTAIQTGQLSGNGIFGSSSFILRSSIYSEDTKKNSPDGGRTITCSKGVYWKQQGKTACEDLGKIKFRLSDGREISNSSEIDRGYKDGYVISQTAGGGLSDGGDGGNGATGGNGGGGGGGGGGSGYSDGSVVVVQTTLGGNPDQNTKFTIKFISETPNDFGDFYQDSAGRILVFSASTSGKDPRTITKTTGKVFRGTDTCIDDARWQRFLEFAQTQDYRLSITLDGKTSPIAKAQPFNIRKMLNSNKVSLKTSLTDWQLISYSHPLYALAWDENSGSLDGNDYSLLAWGGTSTYYWYDGKSSNSFFSINGVSNFNHTTANIWIIPPGVSDF